MDALKFINEWNRMLKVEGKAPCIEFCTTRTPEETVSMVEKWSSMHSRKTRLDVFLEQHPEEKLNANEVLDLCPITSATYEYGSGHCKNPDKSCGLCRREFWLEKVE